MGEILVAYDGSDASRRALDSGLAQTEGGQGDLVVLVVAPFPVVEDDGSGRFIDPTPIVDEGASNLAAAREQCEAAGVEARLIEAFGDPAETIVRYANDHPVNVIILGSGARAAPPPSLGPVSGAVSRDVRCDVVLVP